MGRSWRRKKRGGPGRKKEGRSWKEENGDGPGKKKMGTVLEK
ncbi:MAG TPA: hypothetical protein OIM49_00265 [Clostridiaceae bacterium]|nr:hypothetical protein [Clostridiaceae bacterium]